MLFRIAVTLFFLVMSSTPVLAGSEVVATVNGKTLTAFELNEEFQDLLPMAGTFHGGVSKEKMAELREKALNRLIEKELQHQFALEKGISVPKKDIDSEMAAMEKRFGSAAKFKDALKKSGIKKEELKEFIRKRLLSARAKEQEVTSKARLSDVEIKDYYEKNMGSFKRPVEFRASHILIGVDPASTKEEREKRLKLAKDILARVKKGESFEDLAMRHSTDQGSAPIGGDLGTFHKGMAEEAFEKAVLSLKVGEVSDIVETLYGYHIIKLTGMKPEAQLSLDEVRDDIKKKLEKKRGDELYKNWIEGLRAKAKIEIIKK
jgi:parvulin-like peptidyl-prolyl isomerase